MRKGFSKLFVRFFLLFYPTSGYTGYWRDWYLLASPATRHAQEW